MAVNLFARSSGSGPAVILLHGLFGTGSNLGELGRALEVRFSVHALDLPNHGRSGWLEHLSLPAMAAAVLGWMDSQGIAQAHFIGHSLGGKVAMELALQHPARVQSLLVEDIAPVSYPRSHDAVFDALDAVAAGACTNREEAAALMARHLREPAVIQFLLMSVRRDGGGHLRWRLDHEGIRRDYAQLLAAPAGGRNYPGPVLFIKGGASDYIRANDWPAVEALFPQAALEVVADAGHWLHAEQAQAFNALVLGFLPS